MSRERGNHILCKGQHHGNDKALQMEHMPVKSVGGSMLIYEVATCSDMDAVIIAWQLVAKPAWNSTPKCMNEKKARV